MSVAVPFTAREFFAWVDQVRADRALPPRCFVVAYTIGQHVNRATGLAFPSQATIVSETELNERTVRDAIHALEANGHLETGSLKGRGRGNKHTYRPRSKGRSETGTILPVQPVDKPAEECRFSGAHKPASFTGFTALRKPADLRR